MSCLSERERIALDDIFLSMSVNQSPFERCKIMCSNYAPRLKEGAKSVMIFVQPQKYLKSYQNAKLFVRRRHKRIGRRFGFVSHK
jgi:hypothetical protein